jgi:hypothetical protein
MSHETQTIADEIRKAHLQFEAGRIEIWGVATVRPNDLSYRIVDATVQGDRLDLHLASPYDHDSPHPVPGRVIRCWRPALPSSDLFGKGFL